MLAQVIDRHRGDIISEIERRLGSSQPMRHTAELLHNVPEFLEELYVVLSAGALVSRSELQKIANDQGAQRQRIGLTPNLVAQSFGLLCEVISGIAAEDGLSIPAPEVELMNECIDVGIAAALEVYWRCSSEALERASNRKLSILAHELRNALSTAIYAASAFREGLVGSASRTAAILDRSLERMNTLVNNALTEAQLREIPLVVERLLLRELVSDLDLSPPAKRGVDLIVEIEEGVELEADRRLVGSAITNLVQNAFKFTHDASRVILRGRHEDADVVIEVEDECGGLESDPEQLFAPFVQRHPDRSGVGLGLSISRESIERLGGRLQAHSIAHRGCIFSIRLPNRSRT